MTRRKLTIYGFILLALIQLGVPVSMIAKREMTLRSGRQFKFRTAPVDPYDAFRGRYVALGMEQTSVKIPGGRVFDRGQRVYVTIEEDENGFAKLVDLREQEPEGDNYMKVRVASAYGGNVHLRLPFDRYYMNEKHAPAAEAAYREHSTRERRDAYVSVRVRHGFAVLENLYVGGLPIE